MVLSIIEIPRIVPSITKTVNIKSLLLCLLVIHPLWLRRNYLTHRYRLLTRINTLLVVLEEVDVVVGVAVGATHGVVVLRPHTPSQTLLRGTHPRVSHSQVWNQEKDWNQEKGLETGKQSWLSTILVSSNVFPGVFRVLKKVVQLMRFSSTDKAD